MAKYKALPIYDDQSIQEIIQKGSIEELIILPLSIGEYHPNWKKAQDICISLAIVQTGIGLRFDWKLLEKIEFNCNNCYNEEANKRALLDAWGLEIVEKVKPDH